MFLLPVSQAFQTSHLLCKPRLGDATSFSPMLTTPTHYYLPTFPCPLPLNPYHPTTSQTPHSHPLSPHTHKTNFSIHTKCLDRFQEADHGTRSPPQPPNPPGVSQSKGSLGPNNFTATCDPNSTQHVPTLVLPISLPYSYPFTSRFFGSF